MNDAGNTIRSEKPGEIEPAQKRRRKGRRCIWGSVITRGGLVIVDHRLSSIARLPDWIGYVADRFRETAMAKRLRYTEHQTYLRELSRKKRLFLCPTIAGATLPLFPRFSPQRRIFARNYRCTYRVIIVGHRYVRLSVTVNIIAARKIQKDRVRLFVLNLRWTISRAWRRFTLIVLSQKPLQLKQNELSK